MTIKIAYITTIDLSLQYLLLDQLRALNQIGYTITAISAPGPSISTVQAAGIRHIAVPMTRRITPPADLKALWQLYHIFKREQFDLIHTHTPKANLLGQIAAWLARVPIRVCTIHGFYFTNRTPFLKRIFFEWIERITTVFSQRVFLINRQDIETAQSSKICAGSKIRLLPGGIGVDTTRFDRTRISIEVTQTHRIGLNLPEGAPVIGFVGRLVVEKGVLDLFHAAPEVIARIPNVRFLVIGPVDRAKPDAVIPEIAKQIGVADHFVFTGIRQDMPELYTLMDIFVLPSHREGLPISPMEASAMQVPCIVTNIRGCRDVVEHQKNGWLVPVGNPTILAQRIVQLLNDTNTRRRMGVEGRRLALERFDQRQLFIIMQQEYKHLLSEHVPR